MHLRVYDALGVLPEILASGFNYDRMYIFDFKRELIVEHKFLLGDDTVPAVCALSRLRLHEILLAAAEGAGVEVRTGLTVGAIHDEKDRVTVTFSDGRSDTFDLLAGFDGIRSTTRLHLVGTAFAPRPSGYGGWRVQVPRPDYVRGMEFLLGIGGKTGAMPLSNNLMYIFHICAEPPDTAFKREDYADLFKARLSQYGDYVADVAAALDDKSDIVYSPIEPMLLPWPWFRGRVVLGGDAAHTFPPHLTQGAAMAAEDGYVLAREVLADDLALEERLLRYSRMRYARCAFVYTFSYQWMLDEQSVRTVGRPCRDAIGAGEKRVGADCRKRSHPRQPYLASAPQLKRHQRREHDGAAEPLQRSEDLAKQQHAQHHRHQRLHVHDQRGPERPDAQCGDEYK